MNAVATQPNLGLVSRGSAFSLAGVVPSPIEGVTDIPWARFVRAMAVAPASAISPSGALGAFAISPRRLADLGLVERARSVLSASGKMVWVSTFKLPMTEERFLSDDPVGVQYATFAASMKDYVARIRTGEIVLPDGMSLAGALAVLHRGGRGALNGKRLSDTEALYQKVKDLF